MFLVATIFDLKHLPYGFSVEPHFIEIYLVDAVTETIVKAQSTSHEWMLLDSGQWTSFVLPTDQLRTTVPLITDEQETTPIFHAGRVHGSELGKNRGM